MARTKFACGLLEGSACQGGLFQRIAVNGHTQTKSRRPSMVLSLRKMTSVTKSFSLSEPATIFSTVEATGTEEEILAAFQLVSEPTLSDAFETFIYVRLAGKSTRAVGVEIDPLRYVWTKLMIGFKGLQGQVEVIRAGFFKVDLNAASVVTAYLLRDTNRKLMSKLEQELPPGARVVSRKYIFPDWELIWEDPIEELYVYRMK